MGFVKGRTMAERLQAEGRLPLDHARQVLLDVASALAAAHGLGIVHRDLRPGNVLWEEATGKALLTDFGIAAILSTGGEEVTKLTRTGQIVGNPRYLSPEQLLDRDLTELADVYSFGVMAYEILAGEGPYEARNSTEWITAHLKKDPRDIRELRHDVAPAVADLLKRCLSREPNHRPTAADIVRVLEGGPSPVELAPAIPAPSGGFDVRLDLVRRRIPYVVAFAAAAGFALFQATEGLADRGIIPERAFRVSLVFIVAGMLASVIVGWFHGAKGKQRAPVVEYVLLAAIAAGWVASSVWVLMR